jgi:hypothetical protein
MTLVNLTLSFECYDVIPGRFNRGVVMPKYTHFGESIISRMTIDKFVKRLNEYYGNEIGSGRRVAGFFGCESFAKSPDFSNFLTALTETTGQGQDEKSAGFVRPIELTVMSRGTINSIKGLITKHGLTDDNIDLLREKGTGIWRHTVKNKSTATLRTLAYGLGILQDVENWHIANEKNSVSQQQQSESTGTNEGVEPTSAASVQRQDGDDVELTCADERPTVNEIFLSLEQERDEVQQETTDFDVTFNGEDDDLIFLEGLSSSSKL